MWQYDEICLGIPMDPETLNLVIIHEKYCQCLRESSLPTFHYSNRFITHVNHYHRMTPLPFVSKTWKTQMGPDRLDNVRCNILVRQTTRLWLCKEISSRRELDRCAISVNPARLHWYHRVYCHTQHLHLSGHGTHAANPPITACVSVVLTICSTIGAVWAPDVVQLSGGTIPISM